MNQTNESLITALKDNISGKELLLAKLITEIMAKDDMINKLKNQLAICKELCSDDY
jgi:hypothetical protein